MARVNGGCYFLNRAILIAFRLFIAGVGEVFVVSFEGYC